MVRLFVFSLLIIVVALWVTFYLGFPADPGYLLIAFRNYTFETSLFTLVVTLGAIYLLFRLLVIIFRWVNPAKLVRAGIAISEKRKARERSKTMEGMLYLIRGNWQSSYKLLKKSMSDQDATVINYLAAAYAAQKLDDKDSWERCLDQAEREYPAARSTVNSLRAQLLFRSGHLEQCLAVLEKLKKTSLNDAALLLLLKEVYIRLEVWDLLKELLPSLEKNKIVDDEESAKIRMRIFVEELYVCYGEPQTRSDKQEVLRRLIQLWKKASVRYKENEKVVKHYSELMIRLDDKAAASEALEKAIARNWSDVLVIFYGEHDFSASAQQLLVAESWLMERPANSNLLLSLGRICMRNELWGKAKEYYEASIKITPCAEAYGELSRLLKHLGELEASEICLKNYGDLIGVKLPELPMPPANKINH
ncbi:MAG: heme biosynthesis HemY N-terminal domain-containing protein [Pseudomonadota bacterium]|nr:heme biosynthesis HemY N-terminal domain-containing protein [Pseudomonadota bacterium]